MEQLQVSVYPDDVVISGDPLRMHNLGWSTSLAVFPRKEPVPVELLPESLAMSVDDSAQYLGITSDQVRAFIADGELKYINMGRGKKRPRIRLIKDDLDDFIERRTRRGVATCPSTNRKSPRRTTGSTSKSEVIGFTARRAARLAKTPKNLK